MRTFYLLLFLFMPLFAKYIHIDSFNPLTVKIPSQKVSHFTIKKRKVYKEVFDIKNAITPKFYKKRLKNKILLRIAQFKPHTVRIVYSAPYKFDLNYTVKNGQLIINIKELTPKKKKKPKPKIIVIDPGHGGKDPGAIGIKKTIEKKITLQVAKILKKVLNSKGYKVYLTRSTDKTLTLEERPHFATQKKADLFISLHCNSVKKRPKIKGIEVYYLSPADSKRAKEIANRENRPFLKGLSRIDKIAILTFLNSDKILFSKKLANDVKNGLCNILNKKYKITRAKVKAAPFYVLTGAQMPAILVEMGYISNPTEAKRLKKKKYQKIIAEGIAKGIDKFFKKK